MRHEESRERGIATRSPEEEQRGASKEERKDDLCLGSLLARQALSYQKAGGEERLGSLSRSCRPAA